MPVALMALLEQLALQELAKIVPLVGELIVAGIAALFARVQEKNPHLVSIPQLHQALNDMQTVATDVVREMEAVDWGSYFTGDEIGKMKAAASVNETIGRAAARGLTLGVNDAEQLLKAAVGALRVNLVNAVAGPDAGTPPDSTRTEGGS